MKTKNELRQIVRKTLLDLRTSRDNDDFLYHQVCLEVLKRQQINKDLLNFNDFFGLVFMGKLPSRDTVTRVRRDLQKNEYSLRGDKYLDRKKHANTIKKTYQ